MVLKSDKMDLIQVTNQEEIFNTYFFSLFETADEKYFLNEIISNTNAYVFGGIIRDFFLSIKHHRDIDIVVEEMSNELRHSIDQYIERINQFGGYKIVINDKNIDLWDLKSTWELSKNPQFDFEVQKYLPSSSFFNITAIIYSINEHHFYANKAFEEGISKKFLDIVNEDNPLPELCIVKTYEYVSKYDLKISNKLLNYIIKYFPIKIDKLEEIQVRHYGEVKYSLEELNTFFSKKTNRIITLKKKKLDSDQLLFSF